MTIFGHSDNQSEYCNHIYMYIYHTFVCCPVKVQSLKVVTGCKPTCTYQTGEQGYGMPYKNQYAYKPGALLDGATWLIQMVGNAVYRQVDESMVLTASWPTPAKIKRRRSSLV